MSEKVLRTAVEETGENTINVTIEIAPKAFEDALQQAYMKTRGRISLPGFRKGRVPRKMLESQYGKNFFYEDAMEI